MSDEEDIIAARGVLTAVALGAPFRLSDLEPKFIKVIDHRTSQYVDSIEEADGIQFLCPRCFKENSGLVGTHAIQCWRPNVDPDRAPGPGRWELSGTGYGDLSIVDSGKGQSIYLKDHCHILVINGEITNAD